MSTASTEPHDSEPHLRSELTESCADRDAAAEEAPDSAYTVQTITAVRAIEALRPTWRVWAHSLNTDLDYYLYRIMHDSTTLRPFVIAVYKNRILSGMLVGQIRRERASAIVSFVNVRGPKMRVLEIKKDGRMGVPSLGIDRLLAQELLNTARRGDVDSISFERLPLDSGLFRELHRQSGFLVMGRVPQVFCYCEMPLVAETKRELFPAKTAREIRRKTRLLDRAFPEQLSLKCFSQPGEIDQAMRDALRVAVTTWQYYLGLGLADTVAIRETFRYLAERGWLRIYMLYIKKTPCAFLVGQLYQGTFCCQFAGYQPNYARFSVGSVLTVRAFEHLAAEGVQRVDLGEGGQENNRRLGCQMCKEGTVHIYADTLRGLLVNLFFGAVKIVGAGASKTRSGLHLNWIARARKNLLVSRGISRHRQSERLVNLS